MSVAAPRSFGTRILPQVCIGQPVLVCMFFFACREMMWRGACEGQGVYPPARLFRPSCRSLLALSAEGAKKNLAFGASRTAAALYVCTSRRGQRRAMGAGVLQHNHWSEAREASSPPLPFTALRRPLKRTRKARHLNG